ncbi:hypothetical protein B0T17DRAFT_487466 [Bombardia bombarda]|uniref:WD repeat protein n=1 Tax=Bombardia bombarda TaxID=252184 RepID=A0AA39XAX0_9PEZI|nr:hypothetical protein B0T17DRAFT_487466 [Bombardia bombarda]
MHNINMGNQGKIMRKLLGKQTADSSHDTSSPAASVAITSSPLAALPYRSPASQNAVYSAGVPIACIDRSPDGKSAVLAGRHVLKTVVFDGVSIRDGIDLRALLTAQPTLKTSAPSSVADQLSIKDVKWGSLGAANIFTACASGKIFQYDLTRLGSSAAGGAGLEFVQIREDSRQVNALDINPHRGTLLLSGSQDGIVRSFDIRSPIQTRTGITFRALHAFKCNADGVRHVQWSPKDGMVFACGTEQGAVLKWDMRKATAPLLRINAHERACSSIAWHPDGEHLVSAGWDSKCQVWDMSKTADKRQKPKWSISTPAPVAALAWRPGQWSATAQAKRASQIAVSYDESNQKRLGINSVHIWDLARPTMPYKEIQRFDSSPSAMLWHDQYLLWTAGQDGLFNQCDVTFAPKVLDRQPVSAMSFSSQGEALMFLDERASSHRPRPHILHSNITPLHSYSSSPATPRLSVSRSDSEDEVIDSFLGPKRRRRPVPHPGNTLSTTPPTGTPLEEVLSLEQTIEVTGIYKPQQAMGFGRIPAAANIEVYEYFSANYLETLNRELPYVPGGKTMPERVALILEHYAKAAEYVNLFRLAQTWRVLAYGMELILRRRAQYHLELRMDHLVSSSAKRRLNMRAQQHFEVEVDGPADGDETPRKIMSSGSLDRSIYTRSLLSEELESTSNVPTPIARPVPDDSETHIYENGRGKKLTPILEPESFSLPPAIQNHSVEARRRLDSVPLSTTSQDSENTQASTEGYDFYDTEALAHAIDVPAPRQIPSRALVFGEVGSPSRARKPRPLRHNSDDSFTQLFSISDGSRRNTGLAGPSEINRPTQAPKAGALAELRNAGGSDDGEFGSRIRGNYLADSSAPSHNDGGALRIPLGRTDTDLTSFTITTAYTDEHHLITQTTSGSYDSPYPSQNDPDFALESPQRRPPSIEPDDHNDEEKSPYIVEADYLSWPKDPPYPYPLRTTSSFSASSAPPLQPYTLISRALAFEAKSSALNASAIILLLKPLIPEDVIDHFQAAAILRQHHSRLMSMKLFIEATLLRKLCIKGWPGGVLSGWGEDYPAIFTPAQQGVQVGFLCPKCRKPREIDHTSTSIESIWRCERCMAVMGPCAVCGHRDSTSNSVSIPLGLAAHSSSASAQDDGPILATWWYCPGCGHGGHSSCLQGWHSGLEAEQHHYDMTSSFSEGSPSESIDGCCPLDGCGHACLPGRWRAETAAARTEEVTRAVREANLRASKTATVAGADFIVPEGGVGADGGVRNSAGELLSSLVGGGNGNVRSDGHDVAQSRAVESVREALAVGGGGHHGSAQSSPRVGTSILSSSPGRGEVIRERRKSVKFVATEERR